MTTLESLFERYRTRGELAALGEVFDRTSAGLCALAVHLVRDPVEAEDLVQATFVAAIEGAHSFQGGRRLEPWLAGILARQAARVWRNRGRVAEGRAEADATLDPSFAAEKRELAEALELALARLAPPEREVLRRTLDGERPLDIARSQGRAAGAVRMQVLRGLEKLRRLLPSGLHALLPLARLPRGLDVVRAEVLAHAGGAAVLASAALVPVSLGVLAMSTKLVCGALAACAALFVILWRKPAEEAVVVQPSNPPEVQLEESPREEPVTVSTPASARAPVERVSEPEVALETATSRPAPGVWIVGRLNGLLPELDPALAKLVVWTSASQPIEARGRPDAQYEIEVTSLTGPSSVPTLYVLASHPWPRQARRELRIPVEARTLAADERLELALDIELPPRTVVVGSLAFEGRPGVELDDFQIVLLDSEDQVVAETREFPDGRFELYPSASGELELVAWGQATLPVRRRLQVPPEDVTDAGEVRFVPGGVGLSGRVVPPFEVELEGRYVVAARVDVVSEGATYLGLDLVTRSIRQAYGKLGADSAFTIQGLEPGRYSLALCDDADWDHLTLEYPALTVVAPAQDIVFGENLGRIRVQVRGSEAGLEWAHLIVPRGTATHAVEVAAGGTFDVIADRRMDFTLRAEKAGWRGSQVALPPFSWPSEHELTLELTPSISFASLELEWELPESLAAPTRVSAFWTRADASGNAITLANATGARFEQWQAGVYRLVVAPQGPNFWESMPGFTGTHAIEVELVAGETAHARVEWFTGGRVRFLPDASARTGVEGLQAVVRDAFGVRQPVRFVMREWGPDGNLQMGSYDDSFPLIYTTELEPNLHPGAYELVLSEQGKEPVVVPFFILAGQIVDVPVLVR